MKTRLFAAATTLVMIAGSFLLSTGPAAHASPGGLHIREGHLYNAAGEEVILRGVNHLHFLYPNENDSFENIADLGANAVRAFLSSGHRWDPTAAKEVVETVLLCEAAEVICVLTVGDTTGYPHEPGAASLSEAVDYWISVRQALIGSEDNVIINIGRAPYDTAGWTANTIVAIQRLRDAGFDHALMVDAPEYGQDIAGTMLDSAPSVFGNDPLANTIFSVNMYDAWQSPLHIESYLGLYVAQGLPLVVGEFAPRDGDGADVDVIISQADALGLGYFGWRWSGDDATIGSNGDNMVTGFDPTQLTEWGEVFFDALADPPPGTCTADYQLVSVWHGGFHTDVTVTAGDTPINGWRVTWTYAHGESITSHWNASITARGPNISAVNVSWNGQLDAHESTSFGFVGEWDLRTGAYQLECSVRR